MKYPHWIINSMIASLLLVTPLSAQAEDTITEPVRFLVSLQDDNGNHICNGSYIGNSQILTDTYCKQSTIIGLPPIGTPIDPPIIITPTPGTLALVEDSDVMSQLSDIMPLAQELSLPSSMMQAVPDLSLIHI